jgi:P27 family predicted phage terminase small subunit
MEIVGKGTGSDVLSKVPAAPAYFDAASKRHWKSLAKTLIGAQILKTIHLPTLEILATSAGQREYAIREINKKNKKRPGTGFIQTFASGANNISAEVTLKEKAEKTMLQCIKQFGLDPKSEKELNLEPANQTNLLEQLGLAK